MWYALVTILNEPPVSNLWVTGEGVLSITLQLGWVLGNHWTRWSIWPFKLYDSMNWGTDPLANTSQESQVKLAMFILHPLKHGKLYGLPKHYKGPRIMCSSGQPRAQWQNSCKLAIIAVVIMQEDKGELVAPWQPTAYGELLESQQGADRLWPCFPLGRKVHEVRLSRMINLLLKKQSSNGWSFNLGIPSKIKNFPSVLLLLLNTNW